MTTTKVKIPALRLLSSWFGLGPIPVTKVVATAAMIDEANRLATSREADALTDIEDTTRRGAEAKANRRVRSAVRTTIEPQIKTIKGLHAEINYRVHELETIGQRSYVGPNGETLTAEQAQELHDRHQRTIENAAGQGDVRHRRVDERTKRMFRRILALDIPLIFYMLCRFFNVNLMTFWATSAGWIRVATALVFSVFGTLLVAFAMKTLGRRHRPYRNAQGAWSFPPGARLMLGVEISAAVLVMSALAGAMALRFVIDGRESDTVLTVMLAALFALLTGATAYLAYMSEFADGSTATEALDVVAPQLHATRATIDALSNKLQAVTDETGRRLTALHRAIAVIESDAQAAVLSSKADKAIHYARSLHQQAGSGATLPEPRLDLRSLRLAEEQAAELDVQQRLLEARAAQLRDAVESQKLVAVA